MGRHTNVKSVICSKKQKVGEGVWRNAAVKLSHWKHFRAPHVDFHHIPLGIEDTPEWCNRASELDYHLSGRVAF